MLNEATSALDPQTENALSAALAARHNRTVVSIAHRLSTVRHADQIVVLEQGRVVEMGSHDQLIASNGRYRELATIGGRSRNHAAFDVQQAIADRRRSSANAKSYVTALLVEMPTKSPHSWSMLDEPGFERECVQRRLRLHLAHWQTTAASTSCSRTS
ncbi:MULTISPECIES: hypothetical protein [unclassified Rhizobium]|uniref:hypothetical protein n=1 Tax=unclassified Rhizobium TaxID=2613769 RepID=UPI001AEC89CC|nr:MULTISPECIES: hypothetical protein [unclassified Rhizobium]